MEKTKKFNLFKLLQNAAVVGLFLVVGLGTLFATGILTRTITSLEITIMIGLLLVGLLMVLPWAKYLEQKEYKIVSLIFLIATAVCVVLWEICTLVICSAIRNDNGNNIILHFIRITLLISFQVVVASFIGKFVIKYRAKYIPFQAITYLSMLYIDFWLSTLLFGVSINAGLKITHSVMDILINRVTISLLVLSIVYLGVAIGTISNARKRSVRNSILARNRMVNRDIGIMDLNDDEIETNKNNQNDAEAQLEKIKSMFDKGLITKEEYDAKRQSIIDKM
jgi:hypothetical protein